MRLKAALDRVQIDRITLIPDLDLQRFASYGQDLLMCTSSRWSIGFEGIVETDGRRRLHNLPVTTLDDYPTDWLHAYAGRVLPRVSHIESAY